MLSDVSYRPTVLYVEATPSLVRSRIRNLGETDADAAVTYPGDRGVPVGLFDRCVASREVLSISPRWTIDRLMPILNGDGELIDDGGDDLRGYRPWWATRPVGAFMGQVGFWCADVKS